MASYTPHRPDLAPPERLHVGGQEREIEIAPGVPMRFCWCPPGEFLMGSPESEAERHNDESQHRVRLTQGFWLAKHHITQRQWQAVMGSNPSRKGKGDDFPVDTISWEDSTDFCEKAGLYLPTDAQWEYACRAGTQTPVAIGGGTYLNAQMANFDGGYPYGDGLNAFDWRNRETTLPVACFPPNHWGLHDMHGQLWEWCDDWLSDDYASGQTTDALGASNGEDRVLRGGSWIYEGGFARSAFRYGGRPDGHDILISLRPSSTRPSASGARGEAEPSEGRAWRRATTFVPRDFV